MLKYEGIAKVGDVIRSYDFAGNKDCYIEGMVLEINPASSIGYKAYGVEVTKDTLDNRVGEMVYVPMEVSILEYDGRIENLSGE